MSAVVIMGAGASVDFGVPTLRGLFKDVQAQRYLQRDAVLRGRLEQYFWGPRGQTLETSDEGLTIEEMLTFIQDWEQEAGIERRPARQECDDFKKRLYILIHDAVFTSKSSNARHLNPLLSAFKHSFDRVTWVSFNWDCIFESSFYYWSAAPPNRHNPHLIVDLADWQNGPNRHEYLKLHGSINWWMVGNRLTYMPWGRGGTLAAKWTEYAQDRTQDYPVILEPSAYKYRAPLYESLRPQWDVFLRRLCEAECVLVVGYSLPDADFQATSKMLTAFQVNGGSKWGVIDPNPHTRQRYERLFGKVRLKTLEMGLAGFNNTLLDNLALLFPGREFRDQPPTPGEAAAPGHL